MIYYVDCTVNNCGLGTKEQPFKTIQQAADIARPGDEVVVYPGIYREHVNPKYAGTEGNPIIYYSIEMHGAHITGAEQVKNWNYVGDNVWSVHIQNSIFNGYNPYDIYVSGDWFMGFCKAHLGDVYLNEKSMYEVMDLDGVYHPAESPNSWDKEFSVYTWYCEQDKDSDTTIIYANFHGLNPNKENVEISVRRNCFYPDKTGVNYITFSGFKVSKAATQWAPPTAYQEGMVGPHWSKGWVIEDCEIYESKCVGISLGKYLQPNNDNKWLKWKYKDGTQNERDCICQASYEGWDKEHIGFHKIRGCDIHDCGQAGIVGHLGGVFSIIENNHIHEINNKQNLAGAEVGGIKLHAAIDTIIRNNHIHHCSKGIWLDWQAQGTRVSANLLHHNNMPHGFEPNPMMMFGMGEDLFIEVSHGPTLVDNNIMLSDRNMKLSAQGVALVHNLFAGAISGVSLGTDNGAPDKPSDRYTPYHQVHDTKVAGFMTFLHGDVRIYNNIFIQSPIRDCMQAMSDICGYNGNTWDNCNSISGSFVYDGYPTFEEWDAMFEGYCGMGAAASNRYYEHLPVWCEGNVYFNGAKAWEKEINAYVDATNDVWAKAELVGDTWTLKTNYDEFMPQAKCKIISTDTLGMAFEPEQKFENPDGTPIIIDSDYSGNHRGICTVAGPFAI